MGVCLSVEVRFTWFVGHFSKSWVGQISSYDPQSRTEGFLEFREGKQSLYARVLRKGLDNEQKSVEKFRKMRIKQNTREY